MPTLIEDFHESQIVVFSVYAHTVCLDGEMPVSLSERIVFIFDVTSLFMRTVGAGLVPPVFRPRDYTASAVPFAEHNGSS
jgi:hypothetical protein